MDDRWLVALGVGGLLLVAVVVALWKGGRLTAGFGDGWVSAAGKQDGPLQERVSTGQDAKVIGGTNPAQRDVTAGRDAIVQAGDTDPK